MTTTDTIRKIETRIHNSTTINETSRAELLALIGSLRDEMESLQTAHAEHADSIAGFMDVSTHEATRSQRRPGLLDSALRGLADSVAEVETSHPELAQAANRICAMLANMGI